MTETSIAVTDEDLEAREPAQGVEIKLSTHAIKFAGWRLAHSTTETNSSPRWTTMDLYRVANPQRDVRYVAVVMGCSVVYHLPGLECSSGELIAVSELPEEAEPCPKCLHRGVASAGDRVLYEENIPTVYECQGPVEVVRNLLANTRGSGRQVASRPALKLLQAAAEVDPAFHPDNIEIQL